MYVRQAVKGSGQHSVSGRKVPVGATHHDPVGEEGFEGDTHGRGRLVSVILGVEIGWWCSVTYNYRQAVMFDVVAAVGVGLCRRRGTSRSWLKLRPVDDVPPKRREVGLATNSTPNPR